MGQAIFRLMMRKRQLVLVLTALVAMMPPPSFAARIYTTVGVTNCEKWLKNRDAELAGELSIARTANTAWAAGFVTGINQESKGPNLMTGLDMQTVLDWIDLYCEKNRTDDAQSAINRLFERLNQPN